VKKKPYSNWYILAPILIYLVMPLLIPLAVLAPSFVDLSINSVPLSDIDLRNILADNIGGIQMGVYLVSALIFITLWHRTQNHRTPFHKSHTVPAAVAVVFILIGYNLLLHLGLSRLLVGPNLDNTSMFGDSLFLVTLSVGVLAPVAEEFCFRGLVLTHLLLNYKARTAVLIQAAFFGFIHFNLLQTGYTFILGIILGLAYMRYRSLTITIAGHMAFNLTSLFLVPSLSWEIGMILAPVLIALGILIIIKLPCAQPLFMLELDRGSDQINSPLRGGFMQKITSDRAPAALGPYSHGIIAGMFYVSGQIPIDPQTGFAPEGIAAQTQQALTNLQAVLEAGSATLAQVVKTTCFLTDMAHFAEFNEVYARFFQEPYPARSCVAVLALPKGVLVEIEAIAALS
jgi:reactive intermediate/imine deaminase